MRKNIVQYISDLHLGETIFGKVVNKVPDVMPLAPTLVIAGDLGNPHSPQYTSFLKTHSKRFDNIVVVAGNHEFYHSAPGDDTPRTYSKGLMNTRLVVGSVPRCKFLERESLVVDNVCIAGCTLWTKVDPNNRFTKYMYDRRRIRSIQPDGKSNPWCSEERNEIHSRSLDFIGETMKRTKDMHLLIVTHHVPLETLITKTPFPRNVHQRMIGNAEHLLEEDSAIRHEYDRVWIFGHNHWAYTTQKHFGWSFYSNPCPMYKKQANPMSKLVYFGK